MEKKPPREILFEITPMGATAKVVAIDPQTGTEAMIQGPTSAGINVLKETAKRKLLYVLEKKKR